MVTTRGQSHDAGGPQQWVGQTESFGYVALDRLTSAGATGGNGTYKQNYSYNAIRNVISNTGSLISYTDVAHVHAATAYGANAQYSYDGNWR
jgi:hypothetical protein